FQIKGVSSVGLTIFIGILVIDLYHRVTRNMMEEHEKALLIKRAYTDDLTKLHNRAYCSEHMRNLSIDKNSKYTIINFDLNGLKKMNDTYGHTKGDELICYAAIVLEKSFAKDGVVGRMGGDEFIAIIENDNIEFIEKLIETFKDNIKEVNEKKPDLGLSISYGYATNTELEGARYEKVYHVADERMYVYKQEVKKAMQG
ncbi:MAG: GGDEF domain-containing protein, partial [Lachnospiraceae bacterium]|nr:GGDEF domain-containing protein [Lachnospiraceae bacterium]